MGELCTERGEALMSAEGLGAGALAGRHRLQQFNREAVQLLWCQYSPTACCACCLAVQAAFAASRASASSSRSHPSVRHDAAERLDELLEVGGDPLVPGHATQVPCTDAHTHMNGW